MTTVRRRLESDPGFEAEFRALHAEGLAPREVARRLGIGETTVYDVRRRLALPGPGRTGRPIRPAPACSLCKTTGGYTPPGTDRPERYRGPEGLVCKHCYRRLTGELGKPRKVRNARTGGTPAEVRAATLAEIAGVPVAFEPDPRDEAGGTWRVVKKIPTGRSGMDLLLAAWRSDTDGGRDWCRPWGKTMRAVKLVRGAT